MVSLLMSYRSDARVLGRERWPARTAEALAPVLADLERSGSRRVVGGLMLAYPAAE
jgi:hypothetical protein